MIVSFCIAETLIITRVIISTLLFSVLFVFFAILIVIECMPAQVI